MHSRLFAVLLLCFATTGAGAVFAHHSYADIDREKKVSVTGTLEDVKIQNPHSFLSVRTDEGTLIMAEWANPSRLFRVGFKAEMLNVGDRVTVTGSPTKNPDTHRISLLTSIVRPIDGWQWTPEAVVVARQ